MNSVPSWKKRRAFGIVGGVICAGVLILAWIAFQQRKMQSSRQPTCSIQFLNTEERKQIARHLLEVGEIDIPFPDDQWENPVLHPGRCAIVRFENTTSQPITLYSLWPWPWPLSPDIQKSNQEMADAIRTGAARTFGNDRRKLHLLKSLEDEPRPPTLRSAFVVDEELRREDGEVIHVYDYSQFIGFPHKPVPSPEELLERKPLTFTMQAGERFDLPVSVLGRLQRREDGLKPGTYTIRATIFYAEAPSGETKQVTSEPVTITVTEEHIKAAEAYWAKR